MLQGDLKAHTPTPLPSLLSEVTWIGAILLVPELAVLQTQLSAVPCLTLVYYINDRKLVSLPLGFCLRVQLCPHVQECGASAEAGAGGGGYSEGGG